MRTDTENTTPINFGIILLAAGSSKRLGQPKQLLPYQGQTLLGHALQAALASQVSTVIVVVGAQAMAIKNEWAQTNATMVVNEAWQEGMASSIRLGIHTLTQLNPTVDGVIIMVCDQPFVTPALLDTLLATHGSSGSPIVACGYAGTVGTPVYFQKRFFPDLLALSGDVGAKKIIRQNIHQTAVVPFPLGAADIDTEEDYQRLSNG